MSSAERRKSFIVLAVVAIIFSYITASSSEVVKYQYDELNRLEREKHEDGTVIKYIYDAVGNRNQEYSYNVPIISVTHLFYDYGSINGGGEDSFAFGRF